MKEEVPKVQLYLLMLGMLLTGAYDTAALKLQSQERSVGRDGGSERPYYHPFFQTATMFLGMSMDLALYYFLMFLEKRKAQKLAGNVTSEELE